jgi:hypothetical protein
LSMHVVVSMHTHHPTLAALRQLNLKLFLLASCQVICCIRVTIWLCATNPMYLTHGLAY